MNGAFSRKPANRCLEIIETSPERLGLCLESRSCLEEVRKTVEPIVSSETSESVKEKEVEKEPSLPSEDSDSIETAVSGKEIESDEDSLESVTSYETKATNLSKGSWPGTNDPTSKPSEGRARVREPIVNIRTRGYAVTISPEEYHPPARRRTVPRIPTGRNQSEVQD